MNKYSHIITVVLFALIFQSQLFASIQIHQVLHPVDGQNNGCIEVLATGDAGPFTVQLNGNTTCAQDNSVFSCCDLTPGEYEIIVIDAQGCEESFTITLENQVCDLEVSLADRGHVSLCDFCNDANGTGCTNDGFLALDIQASNPDFYMISWTNEATGDYYGSQSAISDLPYGSYKVVVEHTQLPDCYFEENYQIAVCIYNVGSSNGCVDINQNFTELPTPFPVQPDNGCNGRIYFNPPSSTLFEYYWTFNGRLWENPLTNLCPGEYCLHYENGCTESEPICVTLHDCSDFEAEIISDCYKDEFTLEDIHITGGTPPYSVDNFHWHGIENHTLYITDANGCIVELNTGDVEYSADIDIEVEIVWHFENDLIFNNVPPGSAEIRFHSPDFEVDGTIEITESGDIQYIYPQVIPRFFIPYNPSDDQTVHYKYTSPDGCVFEGEFEVPLCTFPDAGFSFTVERIDNDNTIEACEEGQFYSYQIIVHGYGDNHPYFIEVTMQEAFDDSQSDFKLVQEITLEEIINAEIGNDPIEPIIIHGIPPGKVRFRALNKCERNGSFNYDYDQNCCGEFECAVLDEGFDKIDDGSWYYDIPFFTVWIRELCFDDDCSGFLGLESSCSKIIIDPVNRVNPETNCYVGLINIHFPEPGDKVETYEVTADGYVEFVSSTISGPFGLNIPSPWNPPIPGTYELIIEYVETGCTIPITANFYGEGNPNPIVGFDNNLWFNYFGDLGEFKDAYFGSFRCEKCIPGDPYVFDPGECEDEQNWLFSFFNFVPNEITDPCNSGGLLTIIDFENGIPIIKQVEIPPGVALADRPDEQPFYRPENTLCDGGWCLFDAMDVYGFSFDHPIWATWSLPESCEEIEDPDPDNNTTGTDCDDDFDCPFGDCDDGVCVPNNNGCQPSCPQGYDCINGQCLEFACDYEIMRSSNHTGLYKVLHHNLPLHSTVSLGHAWCCQVGNDLHFRISGAVATYEYCREPHENIAFQWDHEIINPDQPIIIEIFQNKCGEERNNGFHFEFSCSLPPSPLVNIINDNNQIGIKNLEEFKIYPNPFNQLFIMELTANENIEVVDLEIYSLIGELIVNRELTLNKGLNTFTIDELVTQSSGIYLIKISDLEGLKYEARIAKM